MAAAQQTEQVLARASTHVEAARASLFAAAKEVGSLEGKAKLFESLVLLAKRARSIAHQLDDAEEDAIADGAFVAPAKNPPQSNEQTLPLGRPQMPKVG